MPKLTDLRKLVGFPQEVEIITIKYNDYEYEPVATEGKLLIVLSADLEELPKSLQQLKNLKRLDACDSNFSEEYKAQLREWLPWCELVLE